MLTTIMGRATTPGYRCSTEKPSRAHAIAKRVVMMQVDTQDVPHVPDEQRLEIGELGKGFFTIRVR